VSSLDPSSSASISPAVELEQLSKLKLPDAILYLVRNKAVVSFAEDVCTRLPPAMRLENYKLFEFLAKTVKFSIP
jgi:hypothetical protein